MKLSLSSDGATPPADLTQLALAADECGLARYWMASHLFQREPIVNSTMALQQTRRLGIALMAMSPYTVHPVYATMAAAALDEWFPGRVVLCFGTGSPRDLESISMQAARPLQTMRETIEIARRLLDGGNVTYAGQCFTIAGRTLSARPHDIPIMVAASGPRMLELAGAQADGVLISAGTSPQFIARALDHVRAGEARSGRTVYKSALVYTAVAPDGDEARQQVRRALAFVLRGEHHRENLACAGSTLDQNALREAYVAGDWARVDDLIDDRIIANHAAAGTAREVRTAIDAYRDIGLDELVLSSLRFPDELRQIIAPPAPAA
ncbi:LLM class flavin-dependent oxidoreductase [Novacetimonas hansenii]|nr:LLM class flavin-dependent oxidoreductase [Novacetimonas hansenii]PYD71876.1 LLM class flavin-dependent oxidoreductase [Novacetimonas hansenii]